MSRILEKLPKGWELASYTPNEPIPYTRLLQAIDGRVHKSADIGQGRRLTIPEWLSGDNHKKELGKSMGFYPCFNKLVFDNQSVRHLVEVSLVTHSFAPSVGLLGQVPPQDSLTGDERTTGFTLVPSHNDEQLPSTQHLAGQLRLAQTAMGRLIEDLTT